MSARHLNKNEVELLTFMLVNTDHAQKFTQSVNNLLVEEMEDGGMGSLRFISEGEGKFGSVAVEKDFMDVDGIPVFVSIYIDTDGELFELDIWKTDYSPLKQFPHPGASMQR
jgi:hypothetical protein